MEKTVIDGNSVKKLPAPNIPINQILKQKSLSNSKHKKEKDYPFG